MGFPTSNAIAAGSLLINDAARAGTKEHDKIRMSESDLQERFDRDIGTSSVRKE